MANFSIQIEAIVSDEIRNQACPCPIAVALRDGMTEFMAKLYAQEAWLGGFDSEEEPERIESPYAASNGVLFKFSTRAAHVVQALRIERTTGAVDMEDDDLRAELSKDVAVIRLNMARIRSGYGVFRLSMMDTRPRDSLPEEA